MTLQEIIRTIEGIASHQPSVKMVVESDVFRINFCPNVKYGVFAWVQGQHSSSIESSVNTFQFTFFYVDRLKADKSNLVEVQSCGVETLNNILQALYEQGVNVNSYTMQPFSQRFMDECAGVFCSVGIVAPKGAICPETYNVECEIY